MQPPNESKKAQLEHAPSDDGSGIPADPAPEKDKDNKANSK
jgi:hypothetical protein